MATKKQQKDPCTGCTKDKKECRNCEHKEHRALQMRDTENLARQSATMGLEEVLIPYNKETYIAQSKFFLNRTIEDILMAGRFLLVLKEKEGHGGFVNLCEEEIGVPHTTAYRCMNAALKAEKHPSIHFSQLGKMRAFTLLEAPDEDLQELEDKGVLAGKGMDELSAMPINEMRDLIKKLKTGVDQIVKEEVKSLQTEKKALVKELDRLKAFDPEARGADLLWSVKQYDTIDKMLGEVDKAIRLSIMTERLHELPELQAKILGAIKRMEERVEDLQDDFDAFLESGAAD